MRFEFNDNIVHGLANQRIRDGLTLTGEFGVSEASKRAPKDLGDLSNSGSWEVINDEKVLIAFNKEYAAIQEFGGDIKPVDAKALTVPIHQDAKRKKAGDFNDLVYIKRKNKPPLLVRKKGRGFNKERFDIMFVLLKKVTIPAQPYLRPAIYENLNKILGFFGGLKST